jgi:hypothetical protein
VDVGTIIALCVAVVSLALAIRADRRAGRAESQGRRGHPIVTSRGSSMDEGAAVHDYEVRNDGRAVITELRLWVEDGEGDVISTGAGGATTLAPNGPPEILTVRVLHHDRQEQNLIVEWSDADGEHRDEPGIHPPAAYILQARGGPHIL